MNIGITGQIGFIGTHLTNTLALSPKKYSLIPFEDEYFDSNAKLEEFVSRCDVIVHLAAMNRHNNPKVIYETNISLVNLLVSALESTKSTPHVLFSSSTQEERNNLYGKSKHDGRKLIEEWAIRNNAKFTGFIIPNVFGPFGNPYYNSFIATFCHQLTHGEQPEIQTDGVVKLIYVGELVAEIYEHITAMLYEEMGKTIIDEVKVKHTSENKVSATLNLLKSFKENYFEKMDRVAT